MKIFSSNAEESRLCGIESANWKIEVLEAKIIGMEQNNEKFFRKVPEVTNHFWQEKRFSSKMQFAIAFNNQVEILFSNLLGKFLARD